MTHNGRSVTRLRRRPQLFALVGDIIFVSCSSCKCDQQVRVLFLSSLYSGQGLQQSSILVIEYSRNSSGDESNNRMGNVLGPLPLFLTSL